MNSSQYRDFGKQMIDFSANYLDTIRDRQVCPDVRPGYVRHLIPDAAPMEGESFERIMADIEPVVMPGITHWHHPNFYAYFPTGKLQKASIKSTW